MGLSHFCLKNGEAPLYSEQHLSGLKIPHYAGECPRHTYERDPKGPHCKNAIANAHQTVKASCPSRQVKLAS